MAERSRSGPSKVSFIHGFRNCCGEIHSYMTANLHDELLKGNIDLAFTGDSLSNASVDNRRICEFEMRWVTSSKAWNGHPIAGREILERLPLLTFLRSSLVHRDVV